jgi:hypothetical protein
MGTWLRAPPRVLYRGRRPRCKPPPRSRGAGLPRSVATGDGGRGVVTAAAIVIAARGNAAAHQQTKHKSSYRHPRSTTESARGNQRSGRSRITVSCTTVASMRPSRSKNVPRLSSRPRRPMRCHTPTSPTGRLVRNDGTTSRDRGSRGPVDPARELTHALHADPFARDLLVPTAAGRRWN